MGVGGAWVCGGWTGWGWGRRGVGGGGGQPGGHEKAGGHPVASAAAPMSMSMALAPSYSRSMCSCGTVRYNSLPLRATRPLKLRCTCHCSRHAFPGSRCAATHRRLQQDQPRGWCVRTG
jgi:hypothetical protein